MISDLQYITKDQTGWTHAELASSACEAGVNWIQLRMKYASIEDVVREGRLIRDICTTYNSRFILNDDVELAARLGADGVHLGSQDMPVKEARNLLGKEMIIGGTANTIEEALKHIEDGADYIGVGPFRYTETKKTLSPVLGLQGMRLIAHGIRDYGVKTPIIAVGGILPSDLKSLYKVGVSGIAVSGCLTDAIVNNDATVVLRKMKEHWKSSDKNEYDKIDKL
jgi:thiamine-phosphate pyrophosphorylase